MKRIVVALVGMVACGGALAQEARETTAGSFIICMGDSACSRATDECCSVALGNDVQFPPHASHVLVLVLPKGKWPLSQLDDTTVDTINRAMAVFGGPPLAPSYIDKWNRACGRTGVIS